MFDLFLSLSKESSIVVRSIVLFCVVLFVLVDYSICNLIVIRYYMDTNELTSILLVYYFDLWNLTRELLSPLNLGEKKDDSRIENSLKGS